VFASLTNRPARAAVATFVVGAVAIAAVGSYALTRAPPRVALVSPPGIKAISEQGASAIVSTAGDPTVCQSGETLPRGVTGVRLSIWGFVGARVRVAAYGDGRLLTQGTHAADWTSDSVTVPVRPLSRATSNVRLCFTIGPNSEPLSLLGPQASRAPAATISEPGPLGTPGERLLRGRVSIEYLTPGQGSWWSRLSDVVRNVGFGRAFGGAWVALLIAALTLAAGALAVRLTLRELR
jgi:hypothetical protein